MRPVGRQGRGALGLPQLSECRTAVDEGMHELLEIRIAFTPRVTRPQQTNGPLRQDVPVEIQPSPVLIHEEPPDVVAGEWPAAAAKAVDPFGNLVERLDVPARSDDERRSGERIEHQADVVIEGDLAPVVGSISPSHTGKEKQVSDIGRREAEGDGDSLESVGRDANVPALFEPGIPGHPDAGDCGDFLAAQPRLEVTQLPRSPLTFPRLTGTHDAEPFVQHLLDRHGLAVVPGAFFEAPAHFRISLAGAPDTVARGLETLAHALQEEDGGAGFSPP